MPFLNPHSNTTIAKPPRRRYTRREIIRINDKIRAPKVRVIDSETNKQLGVMSTYDAVKIAKEKGLDLVEVTSTTDPPICKIVDYGKFRYDQSKQQKERNKSKAASRVKEVKFRVRIDTHDYNLKMAHAEEFLDGGHKLRVQLQFRGREMAHQELGMELMQKVGKDLSSMGHIDFPPRKQGRAITMMLSPLPKEKRKRVFAATDIKPEDMDRDEEYEEYDDDDDSDDTEGGDDDKS